MASLDAITVVHVIRAIEEYDELGAEEFLRTYGFRTARDYVLVYDGRSYDSKAIVGAAHGHATGHPLSYDELRGGKDGAAKVLRDLGFDVTGPAKVRYTNAATVGTEHARETWALAARERLVDAAKEYHALVSYKELADFVQERSLIRTSQPMQYWIGDVLTRVARESTQRGEPILSALCVNAHGSVGEAYATAVEVYRGETPADPEQHAALERLECHRHFGADLPPGGGEPALPPKPKITTVGARASKPAAKKAAVTKKPAAKKPAPPAEKPAAFCPVHFTQLPATGICDLCE